MHTGSDILDMETFLRASEIMFQTAIEFKDLDYVDFGSGFKVPYKADDVSTDVEALGKDLSKRFNLFCKEYGKELTLVFEPGKFLVSEAGYFVARVNVIKQTTSTVFAGLDTGMNHFIRPMFYDAYHEIINVSRPEGKTRIYTVVGYICETDTFGWNRKITEATEGDYFLFKNAGAYCYAMSSNYNGRPRASEVLVSGQRFAAADELQRSGIRFLSLDRFSSVHKRVTPDPVDLDKASRFRESKTYGRFRQAVYRHNGFRSETEFIKPFHEFLHG